MHSRHLLAVQLRVESLHLLVWQIHGVFKKHLHLLQAQIGTLLSQTGTLLHQIGACMNSIVEVNQIRTFVVQIGALIAQIGDLVAQIGTRNDQMDPEVRLMLLELPRIVWLHVHVLLIEAILQSI